LSTHKAENESEIRMCEILWEISTDYKWITKMKRFFINPIWRIQQ